eukprot:scaffold24269_cov142-Skeletonema_dohrnii-CCMP3373.AAC.3
MLLGFERVNHWNLRNICYGCDGRRRRPTPRPTKRPTNKPTNARSVWRNDDGVAFKILIAAKPLGIVQLTPPSQPLLNGANDVGDCGTESDNLVSIVKNFIKTDDEFTAFTTDTDQSITITSFGDPSLADKLAAMNIFFMVDIENELDGWNPTSQGILNDFVSNGGTLLMTGTSGGDDVQFLNEVFGWDLSNVGCSSANINAANTAGTPWEGGPTTLGCDCATDPISCDSVEFPTEASAAVVVLPYMVVAKSKWCSVFDANFEMMDSPSSVRVIVIAMARVRSR